MSVLSINCELCESVLTIGTLFIVTASPSAVSSAPKGDFQTKQAITLSIITVDDHLAFIFYQEIPLESNVAMMFTVINVLRLISPLSESPQRVPPCLGALIC